jgi:small subunit ribosomal protein S4
MVTHGHIRVNGRKVSSPSYNIKPGDVVEIRDTAATRQLATKSLESAQVRPVPDWITFNREALRAQIARIPSRDDIQPMVNEQLIVEFYSR